MTKKSPPPSEPAKSYDLVKMDELPPGTKLKHKNGMVYTVGDDKSVGIDKTSVHITNPDGQTIKTISHNKPPDVPELGPMNVGNLAQHLYKSMKSGQAPHIPHITFEEEGANWNGFEVHGDNMPIKPSADDLTLTIAECLETANAQILETFKIPIAKQERTICMTPQLKELEKYFRTLPKKGADFINLQTDSNEAILHELIRSNRFDKNLMVGDSVTISENQISIGASSGEYKAPGVWAKAPVSWKTETHPKRAEPVEKKVEPVVRPFKRVLDDD